jgi:iron(III) transport system substrate-binding protein
MRRQDLELTSFTYEELADPQWKGRVCIRAGQHPYNTAMIAAFLAKHGEAKTETWLRGIKANLARKATGGDRDVARDIIGGICDIGIANSYYVGLMRSGSAAPISRSGATASRWSCRRSPAAARRSTSPGRPIARIRRTAPRRSASSSISSRTPAQKIYAEMPTTNTRSRRAPPCTRSLRRSARSRWTRSRSPRSHVMRAAASKLVDKVGFRSLIPRAGARDRAGGMALPLPPASSSSSSLRRRHGDCSGSEDLWQHLLRTSCPWPRATRWCCLPVSAC